MDKVDKKIVRNHNRRFDIDHLRVYAFGLLIFYHTGMLYVAGWEFHIKSSFQSELLANLMLLVEPWRMPLIWMISGIASYFLLKKLSFTNFLTSRTLRLLLPLTFGMLFIIPPQLYFEMKFNGDLDLTFWQFWQVFFDLDNPVFEKYDAGVLPHIDVNHLWYLRALWCFTLILLVIKPLLNFPAFSKTIAKSSNAVGKFSVLIFPVLILFVLDLFVFKQLEGDRARQAIGFIFFIAGYLIATQEGWWLAMQKIRRVALGLAVISFMLLIYRYQTVYLNESVVISSNMKTLFSLASVTNKWLWLVSIFGYAYTYLNKESKLINYLNPAVYPIYILHQTLIISIGYLLTPFQLGAPLEATLVLIGTLSICAISYEIIRRIPLLKPFFGLTVSADELPSLNRLFFKPIVYRSVGILMVIPIAVPIFTWFFGLYYLLESLNIHYH